MKITVDIAKLNDKLRNGWSPYEWRLDGLSPYDVFALTRLKVTKEYLIFNIIGMDASLDGKHFKYEINTKIRTLKIKTSEVCIDSYDIEPGIVVVASSVFSHFYDECKKRLQMGLTVNKFINVDNFIDIMTFKTDSTVKPGDDSYMLADYYKYDVDSKTYTRSTEKLIRVQHPRRKITYRVDSENLHGVGYKGKPKKRVSNKYYVKKNGSLYLNCDYTFAKVFA